MNNLNLMKDLEAADICLIAGHSLNDPGAVTTEKESMLAIELQGLIKHNLDRDGYILVYNDNPNSTLSEVIDQIKSYADSIPASKMPKALLSIHFNAHYPGSSAAGTEAFVVENAWNKTKALAQKITNSTSGVLGTPNRGVKLESESQHDRLAILHALPSVCNVLWEVEFLTNAKALDHYLNNKERLAEVIAKDIKDWIAANF
jgi:N-acetylmuramoyl-L-alanine amidase